MEITTGLIECKPPQNWRRLGPYQIYDGRIQLFYMQKHIYQVAMKLQKCFFYYIIDAQLAILTHKI